MLETLERVIKEKEVNEREKWLAIIASFDEFATEYNKKIPFFIEMYSTLKTKANQDRLIKSRKKKKDQRSKDDFS